ncbi:hypothetical protein CE91St41_04450 [Oscillospiraceae bacterium]|nr:hypothetical protein CE91St40_04470 [Oscillospiraceae bacterium]BDF73556.1 hypothetical protein CE91St41_04450 [Oscillospiraceae bacterium]
MYCRYCGNEVLADSIFCPKCGKRFVNEANPRNLKKISTTAIPSESFSEKTTEKTDYTYTEDLKSDHSICENEVHKTSQHKSGSFVTIGILLFLCVGVFVFLLSNDIFNTKIVLSNLIGKTGDQIANTYNFTVSGIYRGANSRLFLDWNGYWNGAHSSPRIQLFSGRTLSDSSSTSTALGASYLPQKTTAMITIAAVPEIPTYINLNELLRLLDKKNMSDTTIDFDYQVIEHSDAEIVYFVYDHVICIYKWEINDTESPAQQVGVYNFLPLEVAKSQAYDTVINKDLYRRSVIDISQITITYELQDFEDAPNELYIPDGIIKSSVYGLYGDRIGTLEMNRITEEIHDNNVAYDVLGI